ncbi:MAG: hypothetical protein Kow006_29660 [Gammaproteobacteria bacterium]
MTESQAKVRPISANDLEQVVELDRKSSGESRRGFFSKRFSAQQQTPEAFISLAAIAGDNLVGFVFARVLDGEFGLQKPVAVLDAIGVDPSEQGHGVGKQLIAELDRVMESRNVDELHSQADWNTPGLVSFFSAMDFKLAPRLVLERPAERVEF